MARALARHEAAIARRCAALYQRATPSTIFGRWLMSPIGNYCFNTPIYLLPARINLRPKHRVLELGCEQGANLRFLSARIPFERAPIGLDLCAETLRHGERCRRTGRYSLVAGSSSWLPFARESFDLVLAAHLIRVLSEEGLMRLLLECERVLKPGGLVALWDFAPTSSVRLNWLNARALSLFGGAGEPRGFGKLAHLASEAGYEVIERPELRLFLLPPVPRTALLLKKAERPAAHAG